MDIWVQLSEIVRNLGLVAAAFFGIYLAWRRVRASTRQADAALWASEMARRDHVAELFNRAVGQLTDSRLEVRLGAVYTLRQISNDFPDLARPTFELLSTFLRENPIDYGDALPPIDVQEIMNTLKMRLVEDE